MPDYLQTPNFWQELHLPRKSWHGLSCSSSLVGLAHSPPCFDPPHATHKRTASPGSASSNMKTHPYRISTFVLSGSTHYLLFWRALRMLLEERPKMYSKSIHQRSCGCLEGEMNSIPTVGLLERDLVHPRGRSQTNLPELKFACVLPAIAVRLKQPFHSW